MRSTQVAAEAAWGERETAANTALQAALKAKNAADLAVTEIKEQLTKRSWLQATLSRIDPSKWNVGRGDTT